MQFFCLVTYSMLIFCAQDCPSSSVSTSSRVDVNKVRRQTSDDSWTEVNNTLHMLSILDKCVEGFFTDLTEDMTNTIFMLVQAGQHRAKVRHFSLILRSASRGMGRWLTIYYVGTLLAHALPSVCYFTPSLWFAVGP